MGYSMRTDRYRFTRWQAHNDPTDVVALELYDHIKDPDENINLAVHPIYQDLIERLTQQYLKGWQGALPR
jgi:iduronate 2-sulfatase